MSVYPTSHAILPCVDPDKNLQGMERYVHKIGPSWSDYFVVASNQSANNENASFRISFSDKRSAIDPTSMMIEVPVTIVKSAGAGVDTYDPRTEGFASNAVEKIVQDLKIEMDGTTISHSLSRLIYAYECLDEYKLDSQDISDGLKMIDNFQQYSDVFGSVGSPYALIQDNVVAGNRSSHPVNAVYDPVTDTTTINSTLHLLLSRYSPFSVKQSYPLSCDNLNISVRFESGRIARMWRVDAINNPAAPPASTYTFTLGQCNIRYKLNQLPLGLTSPSNEVYQYNRAIARTQVSTSGVVVVGAQSVLRSATFELTHVPSKLIVFLPQAQQEFTNQEVDMVNADFFARIDSIEMTFGNRTQVFSGTNALQRCDMSRRNGLSSDFSLGQFMAHASGKGSIMVIDPIADIGESGQTLTNGLAHKMLVQFNVTFTNMNATNHAFDLNVIEIYDGLILVNDNMATIHNTFANSLEEVIRSEKISYPVEELRGGEAGNFFKTLWTKGKKVFDVIKPILRDTKILSRAAQSIPKVGQYIAPVISSHGYGIPTQSMAQFGGKKKKNYH
jgi:hypothetical protein